MNLSFVLREVVLPAVETVFREDEVRSLDITVLQEPDEGEGPSVQLNLYVEDDGYRDLVVQGGVPHMTTADWRERLRSNLVDFVAESTFGWGENREDGPPAAR